MLANQILRSVINEITLILLSITAPCLTQKALQLPGAGGRVQREAAADGHQRERQRKEETPQEQVRQLPGRDQGQFAAQARTLNRLTFEKKCKTLRMPTCNFND